jgi:hypothetical protein
MEAICHRQVAYNSKVSAETCAQLIEWVLSELLRSHSKSLSATGENAAFQNDAGDWCLRIMPVEAPRVAGRYESY